jgi:hypothetical protein
MDAGGGKIRIEGDEAALGRRDRVIGLALVLAVGDRRRDDGQ